VPQPTALYNTYKFPPHTNRNGSPLKRPHILFRTVTTSAWESHKTHKYTGWAKCRILYGK